MHDVYGQLINLLDEREVPYFPNDESQSVRTDIRGEVGHYVVLAHVDVEAEMFQVLGYSPLRIPLYNAFGVSG